ncbi:hypothetical protein R3Q06_27015 [Rhodococcus erythropolis]|uniref:hypothetical protein n=1 Tax=Rhodococcus erythropolis TaxID=1833 RepID=UPI00294A070B|nr:hypothetical protein [Rhodococcus erythropolis]MDV6277154.1 hypothetical protein [Rhodococcus erythropolis]
MNFEEQDESTGGSRPVADDGPFTLEVDGEIFTVTVRPGEPGASDYDWKSGPNEGYGFSSFQRVSYYSVLDRANSPSNEIQPETIEEHRASIRDFLSKINPETGYIGD